MKINGKSYRTIWLNSDGWSVEIIDQTRLPHELVTTTLKRVQDAAHALLVMQVRGAPSIGDEGRARADGGEKRGRGLVTIDIAATESPAANPAFDIAPARLVSGPITQRSICQASEKRLAGLHPGRAAAE